MLQYRVSLMSWPVFEILTKKLFSTGNKYTKCLSSQVGQNSSNICFVKSFTWHQSNFSWPRGFRDIGYQTPAKSFRTSCIVRNHWRPNGTCTIICDTRGFNCGFFSVLAIGVFTLCAWCIYRFFKKKRPKQKKKEGHLDAVSTSQMYAISTKERPWKRN